jgi:hypothetical protein
MLTAGKVAFAPPRAGHRFTLSMAVENQGSSVTGGVRCSVRLAGHPLRPERSGSAGGKASCTWSLPRTAHGKRLVGAISVTYRGAKVRRSVSATVR